MPSSDTTVFAEIMGKFEGGGATQFAAPSQASDWNFDVDGQTNEANPGENGTGQWNYTGTEYPGVSYWVAKAGSAGFILNWMIADNTDNRNTCASPDEFSVSCLSLAVSVTTGAWTTPLKLTVELLARQGICLTYPFMAMNVVITAEEDQQVLYLSHHLLHYLL